MAQENIKQVFRSKNRNQTRNYFIEKTKQYQTNLASFVTGCITISDFAFLTEIHISFFCYTIGLKICGITVGIKKHETIITKKRKHMIKFKFKKC